MKKIVKTSLIVILTGLFGFGVLASPQQHHRLYLAMSGVVSSIFNTAYIWIQTSPGTWSWGTGSNWYTNSIPILPPTTNTSVTIFPSTNSGLIGNINIVGDPTNLTLNVLNINGSNSGTNMIIAFSGYTNRTENLTNFPVLVQFGGAGIYSRFSSTNGYDLRFSQPAPSLQINFNGYQYADTQTNFPVLVVLSNGVGPFTYNQSINNGYDLRFWNNGPNTGTPLNYEIESFNTNGQSYIWVQIPLLNSSSVIYATWGNPYDYLQPAYTTNGSTWNANYGAVWHMSTAKDSSTNLSALTLIGSSLSVTGLFGGSISLTGSTPYATSPATITTYPLTMSVWYKFNSTAWATNTGPILISAYNPASLNEFWIDYYYTGSIRMLRNIVQSGGVYSGSYTTIPDSNTWHYISSVFPSAGTSKVYLDGQLVSWTTETGSATPTGISTFSVGGFIYNGNAWYNAPFNGSEDEARFSNVSRGSNWVWAEYMNMASNSSFQTYSTGPGMIYGSNLNYEVETWNTNGTSYVWVQVPLILSNGTSYINTYWGSGSVVQQPYTTNGATWDKNFITVNHYNNPATILDSTSNSTISIPSGVTSGIDIVDGSLSFASGNNIQVSSNVPNRSASGTWEGWIKTTQSGNANGYNIWQCILSAANNWGATIYFSSTGLLQAQYRTSGNIIVLTTPYSTKAINDDQYHHVAISFSQVGLNTIYIDGSSALGTTGTPSSAWGFPTNTSLSVGVAKAFWGNFVGSQDEFRASSIQRSSNWIWATYQNISSNALFQTYTYSTPSVNVTIGTLNNKWSFSGNSSTINMNTINNGTNFVGLIINPNMNLDGNLTLTGNGTVSNGLIFKGNISGTGVMTKAGTYLVTLSGSNSSSGINLNSGQINFNNSYASSTNINFNGGSFDNTTGQSITWSNNPSMICSVNPTYVGSQATVTDTGTNTLYMAPNQTIVCSSGTWRHDGQISASGSTISKGGLGTFDIRGSNGSASFKMTGGTLGLSSAFSGPTGTLQLFSTIDNFSGSPVTLSNNPPITLTDNLNFTGSSSLNLGTNTVTISTTNNQLNCYGSPLTINNVAGSGKNLLKYGGGTLIIGGSNGVATMQINGGQLNLNSSYACPTGTLTWSGNYFLDNTSGNPIVNLVGNPWFFNTALTLTYGGSNPYDTGSSILTCGSGLSTINNGASPLTLRNLIIGSGFGKVNSVGVIILASSNTMSNVLCTGPNTGALCLNHNYAARGQISWNTGGYMDNTSGGLVSNAWGGTWLVGTGGDANWVGSNPYDMGTGDLTIAPVNGRGLHVNGSILYLRGRLYNPSFNFTKYGSGELWLDNASNFVNGLIVNGGVLYHSGVMYNTAATTVAGAGSYLCGSSTNTSAIFTTSGGALEGGAHNAGGTLYLTNAITFGPGGINYVYMGTTTNIYSYIVYAATKLNLTNANLLIDDGDYTGTSGDKFLIWHGVPGVTRVGLYINLFEGSLITNNNIFSISYIPNNNRDIQLTWVSQPPDIFTPTNFGGYDWNTVSNWSKGVIPASGIGSYATFFNDTNTSFLAGVLTITNDPSSIVFNRVIINGSANSSTSTVNIGTSGNTWIMDGSSPTISNNVYSINNATNGVVINPNLVLNQNTSIVGSGTAINGLTLNGTIGGTGILTKSSVAELNINSSNNSAGLTMSAGLVVFNNPYSAPTGTVTFTDNPTFDNQSGNTMTLSNNPPLFILSANPTYNGTYSIDTGTNSLTFNSSRSVVVNGIASTYWRHDGPILGSGLSMTKSGVGIFDCRGSNGLASITHNNGTYGFSSSFSAPTGTVQVNGGTIDNLSGSPVTLSNNPPFLLVNGMPYSGTSSLNLGTNTFTLNGNRTLTCNGSSELYISGNIIGKSFVLTHAGGGGLHFAGNNSGLGSLLITAGGINYIDSNNAMPTNISTSVGAFFDTVLGGVTNTLNPNINNLAFNITWNNTPGGIIDWGTGVITTATTPRIFTVTFGTVRLRGSLSGSVGETKDGNGTLELFGPVTIPSLTLNAGQVNFNSAASFPTSVIFNATTMVCDNTSGSSISNSAVTTVQLAQNASFLNSSPIDWGTGLWNFTSKQPNIIGTMVIRGNYVSSTPITKPSTSTGSLILTAAATNSFGWVLQGGTVFFNGDMSNVCTNVVGTVGSGPILSGSGTIRGLSTFSNSGQLIPGGTNHYGTLTVYGQSGVSGGIIMQSSATNVVNILNSTTYGQTVMQSGTFNISGNPHLVINDTGASMSIGTVLTIVQMAGTSVLSGTYVGQAEGSTVTGQTYNYTISYVGGSGSDITLTRQ